MTRDEILDWLEARVHCDDISGCLLWTMATNSAGHPIASVDGKRSRAVRPWLWRSLDDRAAKLRGDRKIMPRCGNLLCLNQQHFLVVTPAQMNRQLVLQGRFTTAQRLIAAQLNGKRLSPYSDAQVAETRRLRSEGLTLVEISAATGVHHTSVSRFCRGERRTMIPGASVFAFRT